MSVTPCTYEHRLCPYGAGADAASPPGRQSRSESPGVASAQVQACDGGDTQAAVGSGSDATAVSVVDAEVLPLQLESVEVSCVGPGRVGHLIGRTCQRASLLTGQGWTAFRVGSAEELRPYLVEGGLRLLAKVALVRY